MAALPICTAALKPGADGLWETRFTPVNTWSLSARARLLLDCHHGGSSARYRKNGLSQKRPTQQAKRVAAPIVAASTQSTIFRISAVRSLVYKGEFLTAPMSR